jgi:hypothetical protein
VEEDLPPGVVVAAKAEHCTDSASRRAVTPPIRFADKIVFLGCKGRIIGTIDFSIN